MLFETVVCARVWSRSQIMLKPSSGVIVFLGCGCCGAEDTWT
jgi:hypothetical protein